MPSRGAQGPPAPFVICHGCGRPMPNLREPVPADLHLPWADLQWIEQRALAGMMLDHLRGSAGRGEFAAWHPLELARASYLRYRQVQNAMRRLVPTGWVQRVSRGVYRLTPQGAELLRPVIQPGTRLTAIRARARGRRAKT